MNKYPIMIVGVGQCGGNIADVADRHGFNTMAINSYKGDLDSLRNVSNRYHLKGYSGAGKNREMGKQSLKDNLEDTIQAIAVAADDPDIKIVMVAFSADGGTGSGCGPLLIEILTEVMPDKVIGAIAVLPTLEDSVGALANSSECISELSNIEELGACIFIDNNKVKNEFRFNKKQIYDHTNNSIIELLEDICEASIEKSSDGNFDHADLLAVLSARGTMIITKTNIPADINKVNQEIKASWDRRSPLITPEYDQKIVNIAFINRTIETVSSKVNKNQIFSEIGTPVEIYEGNYPFQKSKQYITTILSGLSFPYKRLDEMEDIVEKHKNKIEDNVQSSLNQKFENKSGWVNNLRGGRKKESAPKESIADKLKKFR